MYFIHLWYFIHLEKYILFLIGWHYSRYRNKNGWSWKGSLEVRRFLVPPSVCFLFVFEFGQEQLVHPCRAPENFIYFCIWWHGTLFNLRQSFNMKHSLGPPSLQDLISWDFFEQTLKMLKSVLTKSVIVGLLFTLLSPPRFLNCSQGCLWLSDAQQAPHFQCLWGLWELSFQKDFVISVIQEPPGLLMPVVLFLQEITSQFTFSLN